MILLNPSHATIVDILRARALEDGDRIAYSFIDETEVERHLSYEALDRQARVLAVGLRTLIKPGSRVLLLFPSSLDFVTSLFGCLYAGMIAVPAYPSAQGGSRQRLLDRLLAMIRDATPSLVLADETEMPAVEAMAIQHPELTEIKWVTPQMLAMLGAEHELARPARDAVAIVQYTSGSTATPKGVVLTHGNVIENEAMIHKRLGYSASTTFVVWVPLAHDWGLINGVVQPVYAGARAVLMSPQSFVRDPARWLRAVSRHNNVSSGGPNFAYELCVKHVRAEADLDLASWRWASISAEPIRAATLDRFVSAFARSGFRRTAFYPAYGLAEATVMVSGPLPDTVPRLVRVDRRELEERRVHLDPPPGSSISTLVGVGSPCTGQTVIIVDPDTFAIRPAGTVGEVWVTGSNVSSGYWRDERATTAMLQARLAGDDRRFLRTGDLGFFDDGELFITGRLKDVIIVRGRNLHPQDIELSLETASDTIRPGRAVAFSVQDAGDEQMVVVQEVRPGRTSDLADVADRIRKQVLSDHGLSPAKVVLVSPGGVPKTSSGKVQRSACREAYLAGTLPTLLCHPSAPPSSGAGCANTEPKKPTEVKLVAIWSEILKTNELTVTDRFIDVGDSLSATQLSNRVKDAFGVEVPVVTLFSEVENISQLARLIDETCLRSMPIVLASQRDDRQGEVVGAVRL